MQILIKFLSFILYTLVFSSHAIETTLITDKSFELKADYFQPKEPTNRAVLLLHQCNFNRAMYDGVGKELSLRNIHALSLDFRWFGESVDEKTNLKELAKAPRKEGQNPWAIVMEFWPQDVQLAYDFLREKVGEAGLIGVVGASCGGNQAEMLAENNSVNAISFFSSAVVNGKDEKSIIKYNSSLSEIPTLFISAEKDGTYIGTQKAFSLNSSMKSKFISYKGNRHGHPLFKQDTHLEESIAEWFDSNLTK